MHNQQMDEAQPALTDAHPLPNLAAEYGAETRKAIALRLHRCTMPGAIHKNALKDVANAILIRILPTERTTNEPFSSELLLVQYTPRSIVEGDYGQFVVTMPEAFFNFIVRTFGMGEAFPVRSAEASYRLITAEFEDREELAQTDTDLWAWVDLPIGCTLTTAEIKAIIYNQIQAAGIYGTKIVRPVKFHRTRVRVEFATEPTFNKAELYKAANIFFSTDKSKKFLINPVFCASQGLHRECLKATVAHPSIPQDAICRCPTYRGSFTGGKKRARDDSAGPSRQRQFFDDPFA